MNNSKRENPSVIGGKTSQGTNLYDRRTVAGLVPDQDRVPYSVRTSEIIRFLQKKLDVMITDINNNLIDNVPPIPQIQLKGYTVKMSGKHYPFILTMPATAEFKPQRKNQQNRNTEKTSEVDISQDLQDDDDSQGTIKVYRPIYNLLQGYMYDPQVFKNPNIYGAMGLNAEGARKCRHLASFKKTRNKGGSGAIMILLDPFALLHAMLMIPGDDRLFNVMMKQADRVKDGEYIYKVNRTLKKKKNGGKGTSEFDSLIRQINHSAGASLN